MKNKFIKIFSLFFYLFAITSLAEQFKFETSEIEIIENGEFDLCKKW